jgi:hypothetical protein
MHELKNTARSVTSQEKALLNKLSLKNPKECLYVRRIGQPRISFKIWADRKLAPKRMGLATLKRDVDDLSLGCKLILDEMIKMHAQGRAIFWSQGYLADYLGYSRVHVNRCLQMLKHYGFIDIYGRGMSRSCVYKVAPIFFEKHIWSELYGSLPYLRRLMLGLVLFQGLLCPYPREFFWATDTDYQANVTQYYSKVLKNINERRVLPVNTYNFKEVEYYPWKNIPKKE